MERHDYRYNNGYSISSDSLKGSFNTPYREISEVLVSSSLCLVNGTMLWSLSPSAVSEGTTGEDLLAIHF